MYRRRQTTTDDDRCCKHAYTHKEIHISRRYTYTYTIGIYTRKYIYETCIYMRTPRMRRFGCWCVLRCRPSMLLHARACICSQWCACVCYCSLPVSFVLSVCLAFASSACIVVYLLADVSSPHCCCVLACVHTAPSEAYACAHMHAEACAYICIVRPSRAHVCVSLFAPHTETHSFIRSVAPASHVSFSFAA